MRALNFAVGSAPVESAIQGAQRFQTMRGLHTGREDYSHTIITPSITQKVADAYAALPNHDPKALPAFHAMREEVKQQFEHLTKPVHKGGMGIEVNSMDHDPYGRDAWTNVVPEMRHDFETNKRMNVLSSKATGGHPFFSNDENEMFRAVHDVFGHLATGRGVDKHGEDAAFQKHSRMFSPLARMAMATETRGQNAALHATGKFQDQKVALLPAHLVRAGIAAQGGAEERAKAVLQARQWNVRQGIAR